MPLIPATDPRHAQYKWKRLITKPWADLDPHRMRRCEQLAARLHSALGRRWDVRRVDGIYRVEPHREDDQTETAPVALFAPWKELELVVAFRAVLPGSFEGARELSPKVLGLWGSAGPADHLYCVIVPDEGQEDEILLAVRAFVHDHLESSAAPPVAEPKRKPGADAPGPTSKSNPAATAAVAQPASRAALKSRS
jgi:hypothetical protein